MQRGRKRFVKAGPRREAAHPIEHQSRLFRQVLDASHRMDAHYLCRLE
jgi:hypothetical protein